MKGLKKIIVMTFIACLFALQAQSVTGSNRIFVFPLPVVNYQQIQNEDSTAEYSGLGIGTELGYERLVNKTDYISLTATYLRHSFKDYHDFHEVRGTLGAKYVLIPYGKEDASVRLYGTFGVGADYIMRDDGVKEVLFLVNSGLQLSVAQSEHGDLFFKTELGYTFKDGLYSFNTAFGLGYSYSFGGSSEKKAVQVAPVVPVEPEQPVEPVIPAEPEQPAEPVIPAEPEQPAEPVVPAEPEQPAEPVVPAEPEQPAEPVVPAEPEQPAEPVVPAEPEQPAEPVIPAEPEQPAEPVVPAETEVVEAAQAMAEAPHIDRLITGLSIVESTDGKPGYVCFVFSESGIICEIIKP